MKNPYECKDIDELREIAFFWMQRTNNMTIKSQCYIDILLENGIDPSIGEIISRMNGKVGKVKYE
jgi:hypothetical protein